MNLLGELVVETDKGNKTFKVTNKALYKTQIELECSGILDITVRLSQADIAVIVELAKQSSLDDITAEELLEGSDFNIMELGTFFAEQISVLIEGKKKKPVQAKKKKS